MYYINMANEIREPKQKRSIEKKNKIIRAGYELFSEVGYYGTNTAEIAKRAGVSTGIVYGYFTDKRDILLCVLDIYLTKVFEPIFNLIDNISMPIDYEKLITEILEATLITHKRNAKIHEALNSLTSTDEVVNKKFIDFEDNISSKIASKLNDLNISIINPNEKIHLAMNILQSFAHEYVFDKHEYINYDYLKSIVIKTIVSLFN